MERTSLLESEEVSATGGATTAVQRSKPAPGEIAQLAYSYWVARGHQGGSPEEDWFRAESELTSGDGELTG